MNKLKILSILFSIAILTLLTAGCIEGGGNKTTGGGWFVGMDTEQNLPTEGNYVTFGFNVKPVGEPYWDEVLEGWLSDAKGQFQMIDHTLRIRIHGTFSAASADLTITDNSVFMGTCSVNGVGSHMFVVMFDDEESGIEDINLISLGVDIDDNGQLQKEGLDIFYEGVLGGGSIRINAK